MSTRDQADEIATLRQEVDAMRRERDLAIAHDRQPYPTAHAYEAACRALEKHRARADAAEAELGRAEDACASAMAEVEALREERDALDKALTREHEFEKRHVAELAAMRPVVEAAKAWRAGLQIVSQTGAEKRETDELRSKNRQALTDAVDVLDAVVSAPLISADEAKIPQPEPHDLEARLAKADVADLTKRLAVACEQRDTWRTMHHEVEAERDALDKTLRLAATHLVQLVDHGADTVAIGGAIPALRRALDGGGQ